MPALRRLAFTLLVAIGLAGPTLAFEAETAREFVSDLAERATSVLGSDQPRGQREEALRDILRTAFDLDYIGRLVLGPTYRSLSTEQQQAYDSAFKQYVLETYSRRIDDYGGERLEIIGTESAGSQDIKVQTRVVGGQGSEPVRIDWRVRERSSGPKIIDVEIEGVSMAISQRSEFSSVVQQKGVDGLITMLEERRQIPS